MFRRPFGLQRCLALVVLAIGCVSNSLDADLELHLNPTTLLVVLSAFLGALGSVMNEYSVKQDLALNLNVQNAVLYVETMLGCAVLLVFAPSSMSESSSGSSSWSALDFDCCLIVCLSAMLGLIVSRILKYSTSITKSYAAAAHCPIEVITAHFAVQSPLTGRCAHEPRARNSKRHPTAGRIQHLMRYYFAKIALKNVRARQKGDSKREKPDPERTFSQIFADFR